MLTTPLSATLLLTAFFTLTHAIAIPAPNPQQSYNNGLWQPSPAATATLAAAPIAQPSTTAAAIPLVSPAVGTAGGWELSVTWPAGCESWANPCPPGAHIVGGGVAGATIKSPAYVNDFTSYTSQTDSRGVITGMPPVATVPAGVTAPLPVYSSVASIAGNASRLSTTLSASRTGNGFSQGATAVPQKGTSGSASGRRVEVAAVVIGAVGFVAALL